MSFLHGNTQEFATDTSYGQIGRDQAQQERDPWLLTPLSSMRPHSVDQVFSTALDPIKLPHTRVLVQPRLGSGNAATRRRPGNSIGPSA